MDPLNHTCHQLHTDYQSNTPQIKKNETFWQKIANFFASLFGIISKNESFKDLKHSNDITFITPFTKESHTVESIEKKLGKANFLRKEIIDTEKTLLDSALNSYNRITGLLMLKEANSLNREEINKIKKLLGNIRSDKELKELKDNLENISTEELQDLKARFKKAHSAIGKFYDKLKKAQGNTQVAQAYHEMLSEKTVDSYAYCIADCCRAYPQLQKIDSSGGNDYITPVQRMPRHLLLNNELLANDIGNNLLLMSNIEKIAVINQKINGLKSLNK